MPTVNEEIYGLLAAGGMPVEQARAKGRLFDAALARLRSRGNDRPLHAAYVPGRIEFLGKHTDYAGGRSLICAVDRGFCIVASARSDSVIRILGDTPGADLEFPLAPNLIPTAGHWSNYPMTVARRIAQNFHQPLVGADIAFTSDLPQSSGMSSSSAMIIAFFMALDGVNRLSERDEYRATIHTPLELSAYLASIENGQTFGTLIGDRGVGTFGGSEDHTAIINGISGELSQYSFCPVRHERQIPLPVDYQLIVGVSGVIAEKTGAALSAYNNASLLARAVLEQWRKSSGQNDATLAAAVASAGERVRLSLSDPKLVDRLDQFIGESTQIIPAAGDALLSGEMSRLGVLVDRSQDLAARLLKNQVPETICLAKSARECGAVAACSFGAGFGGSVWAMVRQKDCESFISQWRGKYEAAFPEAAGRATFVLASAGMPAMRIVVTD